MDTIIHLDLQLLIQIAFHLFNTGLVIAILAFILYKPVRRFLHDRSDRIALQLDYAAKTSGEAEQLKADYDKKLREIEKERDAMLMEARKIANKKESQIITEAKEEAHQLITRANLEIEREKTRVVDEMKTQIIEISTLLAGRYISSAIDANTQNKLIEKAIDDLGDVEWIN